MTQSLYERLGGKPAIDAAVDKFYVKVLADERVNKFFARTNMERQHAQQKAFLTQAFGGPAEYKGRDMRRAHAHLVKQGLSDEHFDAIVEHLAGTLRELGVGDAEVGEVAAIAASIRDEVLDR